MTRNVLFYLVFTLCPSFLTSQEVKLYEGSYEGGEAVYEYTEDATQQRVFNGSFSYNELRDMPERGGENELLITGTYKNNKKHLVWAVTVKSTAKDSGLTETIIGNYIEGEKSGLWTHRIRDNETDSLIKFGQASFIKNHFRGPFKYEFNKPDAQGLKSLKVNGSFDANGFLDGEWIVEYVDGTDTPFKDIMRYRHGVLAYRVFTNESSRERLEQMDKEGFVTGFFSNMKPVDSSAVVDGEKYGMRSGLKTDHRFLTPLFDAWTDLRKLKTGLDYDASIPMMLFKKGELTNPHRLDNMAEIIPWDETPKGKREMEEKQAVQKAYDKKITVADLQFEQGNYRQAIPLYKDALAIKKEEYPTAQVTKAEEALKKEEEKKQLITLVNSRETLWKGNDKMLRSDSYYGKKKHLFAGAIIVLDHYKGQLKMNHEETRAFLERKAYNQISMEDLKSFQKDLDEAVAFQDRLKELSKQEDTKDLEKEIKKVEDPAIIIKAVMRK
ncbi:MAG: hypothetical protein WEC59_13090 [Salibacteraceae bacterium]